MALVMNALEEEVSVKARGNYFTFKPNQIKIMDDDLAQFLITERAEDGLVSLPETLEDPELRLTEEGKDIIRTAKRLGIANKVKKLKEIIYNNQVSLRQDLERANIKVDPAVYATDAEKKAMREYAKYQQAGKDEEGNAVKEVKELMKDVGDITKK